jgi:hypothetical protein
LKDWNWAGQDAKWERGHAVLLRYVKREGHALVPKPHREGDFALGVWVMHQRAAYRKGRLSEERSERLDRVPGWAWYPREVDKSAECTSSLDRLPRHIADASIDELTEEAWKILFGLGAVTRTEALELVASGLHKKGLVRSRASKLGTRTGDLLYDVLKTAVGYGYLDTPSPEHFRAVLNNAEDYEPSDWRMCLFNSIEDESSIGREEAIVKAAKWAKENLALEYGRLKKNGTIWKHLDQAIETAIRNKEIKQTVFYGVEKIKSLI